MDQTQQLQQGAQAGGQMGGPGNFPQGGPPGGFAGRGGMLPGGPISTYVILALFVITLIVMAIAFYNLYKKAGMSGAIGLLGVIPVVNWGVALYLAYAKWPLQADLEHAKLLAASTTMSPVVPAARAPEVADVPQPAAG